MKETLIIIAIIVIILGGDFFIKKHLSKTTGELVGNLKELREKTIALKQNEDTSELKEEMKDVESKWKKISNIWSIIIMHQEIDNIEQALIRAKSNIEEGEPEDALPEIETAIFFAEHINEQEQLKLKNIF